MMARCLVFTGELDRAVELYRSAIEVAPHERQAYAQLADLLSRRLDQPEEADAVMQLLVDNNADNYEAYLMRYDYRIRNRFETAAAAREEIVKALELAPDNADVILKSVESAVATNQFEVAEADLERGLKLHPENVQLYIALASMEMNKGRVLAEDRTAEALAALQRGLDSVPDNPMLLVHLANLHVDRKQFDSARRTLERLQAQNFNEDQVDFITAHILIGEQRWVEASRLLQKVRQNQAQDRRTLASIDLMLAQCYGALGQLDLQIVAYQRALDRDSFSVPARMGLARALAARGDLADAENELGRLQSMPGARAVDGEIIRLRIAEQLRRPKEAREWDEINAALAQIGEKNPDSVELIVLKSRVAVFEGKLEQAREMLLAAQAAHPKSLVIWVELADVEAYLNGVDQGLAVLAEAHEKVDTPQQLHIAEIALMLRKPQEEARAGIDQLADTIARMENSDEQTQLLQNIGEAYYRLNQYDQSMALFRQVADRRPEDLTLRLLMFSVAREAKQNETMEEMLAEIERLVGKNHTYWQYCEAARIVSQVEDDEEDHRLLERGSTIGRKRAGSTPQLV